MALRTHFTQTEIGYPRIAEFTVQRTEALFDHITGLRQISVAFDLRFRQRIFVAPYVLFLYRLPPFRSGFYPVKGRHSASLPLNISSPSVQLPFTFIFPHTTAVNDSFKRNTLGSASLSRATAFRVNFPSRIPLA